MLTLITGPARSGAEDYAVAEVVRLARSGRRSLLFVPEHASHEAERALCLAGGDTICRYAEVLTFRRLASRIFAETGGLARPVLDEGGRILYGQKALSMTREAMTLFNRAAGAEFLPSLLKTAAELSENGLSEETLAPAAGETDGRLRQKLQDLSLFCSAYRALQGEGALDPAELNQLVAERLPDSRWIRDRHMVFDGFSGFTPPELSILEGMLRLCPSVRVCLIGDPQRREEAFDRVRKTMSLLKRTAARADAKVEIVALPLLDGASPLSCLEQHLFSYEAPSFAGPCPDVVRYRAADPLSECEWAASEILTLVREKGWRYRDIALLLPDMERYGPLLETVFHHYGVPLFLSAPSDILQKPVFAFACAALGAVEENFEPEPVFRALRTGFLPVNTAETDLLISYVSLWKIKGKDWERPFSYHPDGYGAGRDGETAGRLAELNGIRLRAITPLAALKRSLQGTGKGRRMAEGLYAFLEALDLPGQVEERVNRFLADQENKRAEETAQLWNLLCRALGQFAETLGDDEMDVGQFSALLRLLLSAYSVDTIPPSLDQVTASPLDRLGHHREKCVLILGAVDGALPAGGEEGLFSPPEKEELLSLGLDLGQTLSERSSREFYTIYRAMTHPTDRLYLSYPASVGGGERRPAYLYTRLGKLFPQAENRSEGTLTADFHLRAEKPLVELACLALGGDRTASAGQALSWALASPDLRTRIEPHLARKEAPPRPPMGDPAVIRGLYGDTLRLSPSRIDRFHHCPFAFFMEYGLKAKGRKESPFEAPEAGTFIHYVLENVVRDLTEEGALSSADLPEVRRRATLATERYVDEVLGGMEDKSARFAYLFSRLARSVAGVAWNVVEELQASLFNPLDFELDFSPSGQMEPYTLSCEGGNVTVIGKVDRVDGYREGGKLYLRVMDYKSGVKSFQLSDVTHGVGLQMLIYLFALEKKGLHRYRARFDEPVEAVLPAGILYVPAREPVLSLPAHGQEGEYLARLGRELRRSGLLLDQRPVLEAMEQGLDGEARFLPVGLKKDGGLTAQSAVCTLADFGRIARHVESLLSSMAEEIRKGRIEASPCKLGAKEPACRFCDYLPVCMFDESRTCDRVRAYPADPQGEVLKKLAEEYAGEGGSEHGADLDG